MSKICSLASSSSGNSFFLESRGNAILIDAGISARRITTSLKQLECAEESLKGILISHEHSDHVAGLTNFLKKRNIPIYSTKDVLNEITEKEIVSPSLCREIKAGESFYIENMEITAFKTPHDSTDSVGYRINTPDGHSFAVATDMGHISDTVIEALKGCEAVILEANYDPDLLRMGQYPYFLKRRISGPEGHLPNSETGKMARMLVDNGTTAIMLAHLSKHNNNPALASATVEEALTEAGLFKNTDYRLLVAPYDTVSDIIRL